MYKAKIVNKYSDLSEKQWKKFYDLRLLLEERIDSQTPFKSFAKFKEIMPNVFNENLRFVIITKGQKFVAIIAMVRKEKELFFNARLDIDFNSLLYDLPLEMVELIKRSILDFKQKNEPVYLQANSYKCSELAKTLNGKLSNDTLSYELDINDIVWDNINEWYKKGRENTKDLTLRLYKGLPKNEKVAKELLSLWEMVDMDIPNEDNYCDFVSDRSYITDWMDYAQNNGGIEYFYTLFEKDSKKMIGLTNISFYPEEDGYASQSITGIIPKYRNRGLGKYLKAVILKKLLKDYPDEFKGLRTSVNSENHPIIKITKLMGFRYKNHQVSYKLGV